MRSINNVVDVTNYVMLECGHPLHAFDYNLLAEHRIVVRRAENGEKFVAIDDSKHELTNEMLVIADATRPVALAGIMGGKEQRDQRCDRPTCCWKAHIFAVERPQDFQETRVGQRVELSV